MSSRRSVYADKLIGFTDFALGDDLIFQHRQKWAIHFQQRIGQTFDHRIILEIGCFDAAYLSSIARKFPNTAFIGLDWKCKAIYDGALQIATSKLRNVMLLRARADDIGRIFSTDELDEVWVFHPDPCDTPIELKNRLISESFLHRVHSIMKHGSILALKTDHPGYFQWTLGLFGIPEPDHFKPSRSPSTDTLAMPKIKAKELMNRADIPAVSDAARSLFEVTFHSFDFWQDPTALAHTSQRLFTGVQTLFERRFTSKRLPIYYFEMRKR